MKITTFTFMNDLVVTRLRDSSITGFYLAEDYDFFYKRDGRSQLHVIPSYKLEPNFWTDLASVPPFARPLIDPLGPSLEPSVIHDWLYWAGRKGKLEGMTKEEADEVFLAAMVVNGVDPLTRSLMYGAVVDFGWTVYGGRPTMGGTPEDEEELPEE